MEPTNPHVCPGCGYEYEPWVEVCPDCKVPVERKRANSQPIKAELDGGDPHWTVVGNVPNAIIGNLIKSQLEDAGIPVLLMRSTSVDVAEFSHNDYVPHDLRVPRNRLHEARQLIDSPPDADPFGLMWNDYGPGEEEEEINPDPEDAYTAGRTNDWLVLPAAYDASGRQSLARTPGQEGEGEGWYWSDRRDEKASIKKQGFDPYGQSLYDRSPQADSGFVEGEASPSELGTRRQRQGKAQDPYSPSKWVKVVYAILMLTLSLPFILSLLQNFWNFGK